MVSGAIFGFVGTICSTVSGFPQARKIWNYRHYPSNIVAVSVASQWVSIIANLNWLAYAVYSKALWVGAPAPVIITINLFIIWRVQTARGTAFIQRFGTTVRTFKKKERLRKKIAKLEAKQQKISRQRVIAAEGMSLSNDNSMI